MGIHGVTHAGLQGLQMRRYRGYMRVTPSIPTCNPCNSRLYSQYPLNKEEDSRIWQTSCLLKSVFLFMDI